MFVSVREREWGLSVYMSYAKLDNDATGQNTMLEIWEVNVRRVKRFSGNFETVAG